MRTHLIPNRMIAAVAAIFTALALAMPAQAQVITSDPSLPVLYPTGQYVPQQDVFSTYHGPGLTVVFSSVTDRAFGPVVRNPSGPNELENFSSTLAGLLSVNGSAAVPMNASGPTTTDVFGKIGNTTGTFNTEMLALNLTGNSAFGPFMIRESPTLASTGQTTVTDIGGGQYRVDSFFDIYTELSLDGGLSWIPSDGATYMTLVPEPSVCVLAGLAVGLLTLRRFGRRS